MVPTSLVRRIVPPCLPVLAAALMSGCVVDYANLDAYGNPTFRPVGYTENVYYNEPCYYYGGVQYYYIEGRYVYYSRGRRYYVQSLPRGGTVNPRHPLYSRSSGGRSFSANRAPAYGSPGTPSQNRPQSNSWQRGSSTTQRYPGNAAQAPYPAQAQPSRSLWGTARPMVPSSPSAPVPSASTASRPPFPAQAPSAAPRPGPSAAPSAQRPRSVPQRDSKAPSDPRAKKTPSDGQN